jgi:HSP20 family molecular chaperone IbpA
MMLAPGAQRRTAMDDWMTDLFAWNQYADGAFHAGEHEDQDRFAPIFAIHETPEGYDIESDVVGASADDIRVQVRGQDVLIDCNHAIEHVSATETPMVGSFSRTIHLSHRIDAGHIRTALQNGRLTIHATKQARS